MRCTAGLLILPLVWAAAGCTGGSGDHTEAVSGRDLTTAAAADVSEGAVASDLELGRAQALPETRQVPASEPAPEASGDEASVAAAPAPAPALVSFTDGIDLASEPVMIDASLPVLGAGAGTLLRPGVTVAAVGNPVDLFKPTNTGDSPWPEAQAGEFPTVNRNGMGLVIGSGGGGHCPAPIGLY